MKCTGMLVPGQAQINPLFGDGLTSKKTGRRTEAQPFAADLQGAKRDLIHHCARSSAFHTKAPGCGNPRCASTRQTNWRAISSESTGRL